MADENIEHVEAFEDNDAEIKTKRGISFKMSSNILHKIAHRHSDGL